MGLFSYVVVFILVKYFAVQSVQDSDEIETSLYDFVAMGMLEDYIDLLEMVTWTTRRVRSHIDNLVENSFGILVGQQNGLDPVLQLAEDRKKPECGKDKGMNVTDIVFREYFGMNLNCPLIGQRMSIFFNEMHNITTRMSDIHRRYIGAGANCGPPVMPTADRNCLNDIINNGKTEIEELRRHMLDLNYEVEDFMDGQEHEATQCLLTGMSKVRHATKEAIKDIHICLDGEYKNPEKVSMFVLQAMGQVKGPYDHMMEKELPVVPPIPDQPIQHNFVHIVPPQMPQPHYPGVQLPQPPPPPPQGPHYNQPHYHQAPYGPPPNYHQHPAGVPHHPYGPPQYQPTQNQKQPPPWRTNADNVPNAFQKNQDNFGGMPNFEDNQNHFNEEQMWKELSMLAEKYEDYFDENDRKF